MKTLRVRHSHLNFLGGQWNPQVVKLSTCLKSKAVKYSRLTKVAKCPVKKIAAVAKQFLARQEHTFKHIKSSKSNKQED